jgi:hypothetical protein
VPEKTDAFNFKAIFTKKFKTVISRFYKQRVPVLFKNTILKCIYLGYFVCVSVCHNCRTLSYSFSFSNQTDQGDETEGLEREG